MFKYDANDTMRLIARQNIAQIADIAPNLGDILKDIMTANGFPEEFVSNHMIEMGADIILYGVILGKRIERQRNKLKYGLSDEQRNYLRIILEVAQKEKRRGRIMHRIEEIVNILYQINDQIILTKIYTVAKTHLAILQEKGGVKA